MTKMLRYEILNERYKKVKHINNEFKKIIPEMEWQIEKLKLENEKLQKQNIDLLIFKTKMIALLNKKGDKLRKNMC